METSRPELMTATVSFNVPLVRVISRMMIMLQFQFLVHLNIPGVICVIVITRNVTMCNINKVTGTLVFLSKTKRYLRGRNDNKKYYC